MPALMTEREQSMMAEVAEYLGMDGPYDLMPEHYTAAAAAGCAPAKRLIEIAEAERSRYHESVAYYVLHERTR